MTCRGSHNMSQQLQQARWWEKTVEYAFVLQCLPEAAAIAPLSGVAEEGTGDATLRIGETYLLIEFKAKRARSIDELEKFERSSRPASDQLTASRKARLETSLAALRAMPQSDAHQLVFGHMQGEVLRTAHVRYTDALDKTVKGHWLDRESVKRLPKRPHKEMLAYLAQLRKLRGVDTSGGSVVVGVSAGGTSIMTIEEFERGGLYLELNIARSLDLSPGKEVLSATLERASRSKGLSR